MRGIKHRTGFTGNTRSVCMQSMHGADQYKQRAGERGAESGSYKLRYIGRENKGNYKNNMK